MMVAPFNCAACGKQHLFRLPPFLRQAHLVAGLNRLGHVVVWPPLRFFCDEECHSATARDVTPPKKPHNGFQGFDQTIIGRGPVVFDPVST